MNRSSRLTFTKKMLINFIAFAKIFSVRDDIKQQLDDLAMFVSEMINVHEDSEDANKLLEHIHNVCLLIDEENAYNILKAFEEQYFTTHETIKKEISNIIERSQDLLNYQTDKRNLISDIVSVATDNIHGYINEKNMNFYAFNHEVTLHVLKGYSETNDIDGIPLSNQQKKTLAKIFNSEEEWKQCIPAFYNSIYDEVAQIYHIPKQDLIKLQIKKQQRNELSHLNSFMRSHGNKYFQTYFPKQVKKIIILKIDENQTIFIILIRFKSIRTGQIRKQQISDERMKNGFYVNSLLIARLAIFSMMVRLRI